MRWFSSIFTAVAARCGSKLIGMGTQTSCSMCYASTPTSHVMLEATAAQTGSIFNLSVIIPEPLRLDGLDCPVQPTTFVLIMLDGWTHASEHYVAVFASYEVNGSLKIPLLSVAPLLSEVDDDLSAESHHDFLAAMLPRDHGVQLEQCRFVTTCKASTRFGSRPGIDDQATNANPFGETSTSYSPRDEVGLDLCNGQALLRVVRVYRRRRRRHHGAASRADTIKRLRILYQELRDILSVSEALQVRDIHLLDVREWFDELDHAQILYTAQTLSLGVFACLGAKPTVSRGLKKRRCSRSQQTRRTTHEKPRRGSKSRSSSACASVVDFVKNGSSTNS
ncbi:hypothetical protein GQ600_367 [Phytophthora cactorum]|nr:hypothetical protein GQ600_367 [Phytophthora cactorum]